jgi:hypothetical protein
MSRVAGRHLALGFGRADSPAVDLYKYNIYVVNAHKVAVPKSFTDAEVKSFLYTINMHGAAAVRYTLQNNVWAPRRD